MDAAMRARRNRQFLSLFLLFLLFAAILTAGVAFAGLAAGSVGSAARVSSGTRGAPAVQGPLVAQPVSTITWQPASNNFGEPDFDNIAPAVHPTDPLRAVVGGPRPSHILYTTDGGTTWQNGNGLGGLSGGVPAWVPGGNGQSALYVSLSQGTAQPQADLTPGPTGNALNFTRSTDSGANWSAPITLTIPGVAENQPYLWADANPSSPYYGRMYLTATLLDTARTGSFDTVAVLRSTDQGTTWSTPVGLVNPNEFAQGTNYNAFASAAIQPNGGVVVAWHRGTCCQTITGVPNKVMWSRSTDGGVTFPVSGTIATVPISQSLQYNTMSPAAFRWTPAPNIAADPVDGTLYAVWVAYRSADTPTSAAVYFSRSTDNGASWSTPVVAGNGSYQYWYLPWVQVSPDHVVHLTFQGAILTDLAAHFYVQSTDRGATWSTPFQLSGAGYSYFGQGDVQATSLGGYNGSQGTILTSWQLMIGSGVRIGTFPLVVGTPTATATATPTCAPGWTISPNPAPPGSVLNGITALAANDLWAVGSYTATGTLHTLTLHGNGNSWTQVPIPDPPSGDSVLRGVAGIASNDVWAVGYYHIGNTDQTLTEHWNGTAWTVVASPVTGILHAVTVVATNDVWAVGQQSGGPLILHWDGSSWNQVPCSACYVLYGVAAVATNDVWTVGAYLGAPIMTTAHWNGTSWTGVSLAEKGIFRSVAAAASNDVWAVGCWFGNCSVGSTATFHWNGTGWSSVPNPNVSGALYGVTTMAANEAWAVGGYAGGATLTMHCVLSGCSIVASPGTGSLNGVAAVTANDVWAVGNSGNSALILHYSSSCATATATPTVVATATCTAAGLPGPWTSRGNYPLYAGGIGVASDGTTLYAFCGRQGGSGYGAAYKYDYATDTWTGIASPAGTGCAEAGAEYGQNGKIYLIGGTSTTGLNRIYDIASNSWTQGAPLAGPRDNLGHAYWNGKVYVIGGYYSSTIYDTVYAYDIASDTWSTLAPLPQAEYGMASAAINGKIYVANGNTGSGQTNNLYIYDIATNTWSAGSPSPLASGYAGSTAIGGKLYMIAGGTLTYLYDPASNSWSQGPSLNVGRADGNAATINTPGGQTAIVVGGLHSNYWTNSAEASNVPSVPCATATATHPPGTPTRTPTATATCTLPSWTIYPNPAPPDDSVLNGITRLAPNDLWAVGAYTATGTITATTLTVHSNGMSWTYVPSPNPPSSKAVLQGVAGVAANDVWAVGYYGASAQTLTEHWNGTSWSIVPSPNPAFTPNRLYAVTAIASNNVWAVGRTGESDFPHIYALIEHWDGTSWSIVPNPGASTTGAPLYGVSAVSANDVWAVGGGYPGGYFTYGRAYTEHWDGSTWTTVSNPADYASSLYAVAAVASNDVWAVGQGAAHTLIEHWDGTTWSIVPGPNPGATTNRLYGVSARAANDVWAVGDTDRSGGGVKTLALHWDGSSWTQVATPDNTTGLDHFYGVVAMPGGDVWAVGTMGCTSGCTQNALIARYNPPCTISTPTSIPTNTPTRTATRTNTPSATPTPCGNVIQNGGFETGSFAPWVADSFNPPPQVVTSPHHAGAYAAKVGTVSGPEPTGDSSFYQQFTMPPDGATLSFWYYPSCACGSINFDYQDVYITDTNGQILATLMHVEEEDAMWKFRSYNLGAFAGQTVRVKFLVNQDGFGNDTFMVVDDVAVQPAGGCVTATASPTTTRTSTPTATATACFGANPVENGDFETGYIYPWVVDGLNNAPFVTTSEHHSGFFSVQVGTVSGPEPLGNSSLYQQITVPPSGGTLSFWWNGGTGTGIDFDYQDVYVTDTSGNILATIMHVEVYTGSWINQTYNMAAFAGQTVRIKFLVYEDGFGDDTWMYVDDVALLTPGQCPTGTPPTVTPTSSSTATPCVPYWSRDVFYPIPIMAEAAVAQDGVLYSFGGYSGGTITSDAYKFDGTRWTAIAPLPGPRADASALSDGQYIYILNGYDSPTHAVNTLYRYDPASNTYTQLASPVYATAEQGAALLGGMIYRIAGCFSGCAYTDSVEAYTIATNSWRLVASYPLFTFGLMAVASDGYIYAGGGRFNAPPLMTGQTFRYDPASDSWSDQAIADLPTAWANAASAWLNGQWMLAGTSGYGGAQANAVAWNPATNTWHALPPPPEKRSYTSGAAIGTAFYMIGGWYTASDNLRYQDVVCATATPTSPPVNTPTPTRTNTTAPTATSCPIQFTDVPGGSTFYVYIRCLACTGVVSGYSDGTFRPNNNVTRGQLSKIVSNAAGFNDPQTVQMFEDVPPGSTFFDYIGRLASRGYISGYPCGGTGEPCNPPGNLPYFRTYNNATRGQITKIVSNAAGFSDPAAGQTFEDVPPGSTFYTYTQRLASRGVMQGYPCGGGGEPCLPPADRPYFRPFNNATRGQTSKIVANTFFPDCDTPRR